METEQYEIKFEYIRGIKNILADTKSRLIVINPGTCQDQEPEGQDYGYCVFENYLVKKVSPKANVALKEIMVSLADSGSDL